MSHVYYYGNVVLQAELYCKIVGCKVIENILHYYIQRMKNQSKQERSSLSETQSSNTENKNQNGKARGCFTEVIAGEGMCSATGAGASATGLAIVSVNVKARGKEKMVQTYAFLDPVSNTTFCTDKLLYDVWVQQVEKRRCF